MLGDIVAGANLVGDIFGLGGTDTSSSGSGTTQSDSQNVNASQQQSTSNTSGTGTTVSQSTTQGKSSTVSSSKSNTKSLSDEFIGLLEGLTRQASGEASSNQWTRENAIKDSQGIIDDMFTTYLENDVAGILANQGAAGMYDTTTGQKMQDEARARVVNKSASVVLQNIKDYAQLANAEQSVAANLFGTLKGAETETKSTGQSDTISSSTTNSVSTTTQQSQTNQLLESLGIGTQSSSGQSSSSSGGSTQKSGWCFITTAVMKALGEDDNCFELQVMRKFRDTYVKSLPFGEKIVSAYYVQAPQIVAKINTYNYADTIWQLLFNQFIKPIVALVELSQFEEAFRAYTNMCHYAAKAAGMTYREQLSVYTKHTPNFPLTENNDAV